MNSNNNNNNNKGTSKGNSKGDLNNDILNSSSEVTAMDNNTNETVNNTNNSMEVTDMNNNTNETVNTTAKNINTNETDKTVGTKELPTSNNDVTDKDSIITGTANIIENESLSKTVHKKWGIIVKPENKDKIMREINKAQRNATSRTIENFNHITTILKDVERRIGPISKSSLEGTYVYYDHGQHFPNSYRWTPNSTHVSFTYHNGKWYFGGAVRTICPNRNSGYHYKLTLSESAKKAILARYE